MKRILLKKLLIAISAIAFISYGVLLACGGGDWDEYSYSSFSPEAFVDSSFTPFCFSESAYYGRDYDNNHIVRFNDIVVHEWSRYLGKAFSKEEIRYLLLSASKGLVDSINNLPIGALPPAISSMKMVQDKRKTKVASFFDFLALAKANESYATVSFDYWDYDDYKPRKVTFDQAQKAVMVQMEKLFHDTKDGFLRQRYFFQIIRAHFFQGNYKLCIEYHEKYKAIFPPNIMAARCLGYVAGCYYKLGNYAQANYLYSKIYDVGDEFKTIAHFSFHPQNETDWRQTLALCKSKEEQITLWHLIGIYFDEQRAIKEIYTLDPKSKKLDLLLSRLVNLEERKVNNDYYDDQPLKGHLDSFALPSSTLVANIAKAEQTSNPYWWHLSAGYLCFLKSDFQGANDFYHKAKRLLPNESLAIAQYRLFVLLNRLAAAKKNDISLENQILPDLIWLQNFDRAVNPHFRYDYAYAWAKNLMAKKYADQKEMLKSELFRHQDSFYSLPQSVGMIKSFLQKSTKTDFERYCASIYPFSVADINELQAVIFSYRDNLEEAIQLMESADKAKSFVLYGNPFNGTIKDCHDCDHAAPQKVKYTKLSFLYKMQELKANVETGRDVYNNALLLGNAFYNMSYYGNARCYYEGPIIHTAFMHTYFEKILSDCSIAKKYYQMALKSATNAEQRAKASYLALKCDRNEYYNGVTTNNSEVFAAFIPPIDYGLMKQFEHTKYYAEVIKECGYFRAYLANRK